MHSHNYRENSSFTGQRVVVVGASASGQDISRDIALVAAKVSNITRCFLVYCGCFADSPDLQDMPINYQDSENVSFMVIFICTPKIYLGRWSA